MVGIWIPIFSIAFANSSGSTVPLSLRSKYLKAFISTCCSDWAPFVFSDNLFFNSLSKLHLDEKKLDWEEEEGERPKTIESIVWLYLPCFKMIHIDYFYDVVCSCFNLQILYILCSSNININSKIMQIACLYTVKSLVIHLI